MLNLNNICRKYLHIFFLGCIFFYSFNQKTYGEVGVDTLKGHVVLKPLPVVGRKVMEAIQVANVPHEQVMFLYLFLSFLGYPDFADFSKEDAIYIFVHDDGSCRGFKWVVAAKLGEKSGTLERIKAFNWATGCYKGWTLISGCKENFKLMESNARVNEVLGVNGKADVEVKLFLKEALRYMDSFEGEPLMGCVPPAVLERVRMLVDQGEWVEINCNIQEKMVGMDVCIKPSEGGCAEKVVKIRVEIPLEALGGLMEKVGNENVAVI